MFRSGVRLGIDVGKSRIGVAKCDPHALLATPVETVSRDSSSDSDVDIQRILQLAREESAIELVIGLPLGLSGHHTASTEDAADFAERLAVAGDLPVRLVDERLTTRQAQGQLQQVGRKTKQSRGIIDQVAAVVILQHAIDTERARGEAPGSLIELGESV